MTHSERVKRNWQDPEKRRRMLSKPEKVRAAMAKMHPFDKALHALRSGRIKRCQSNAKGKEA